MAKIFRRFKMSGVGLMRITGDGAVDEDITGSTSYKKLLTTLIYKRWKILIWKEVRKPHHKTVRAVKLRKYQKMNKTVAANERRTVSNPRG